MSCSGAAHLISSYQNWQSVWMNVYKLSWSPLCFLTAGQDGSNQEQLAPGVRQGFLTGLLLWGGSEVAIRGLWHPRDPQHRDTGWRLPGWRGVHSGSGRHANRSRRFISGQSSPIVLHVLTRVPAPTQLIQMSHHQCCRSLITSRLLESVGVFGAVRQLKHVGQFPSRTSMRTENTWSLFGCYATVNF